MNRPCFAKRCGASWSGRSLKSPRPAFGICDVPTPTPSAYPYGYSIWTGGASDGEALVEIGWVGDGAELPVGPKGAVSWLVEMLRVGTALVSSKCWWMLLVFVGVRASESVGDVGVTCTVVGCWLLDDEVGPLVGCWRW